MPRWTWVLVLSFLTLVAGLYFFSSSKETKVAPRPELQFTEKAPAVLAEAPKPTPVRKPPPLSCNDSYSLVCEKNLPKQDPTGSVGLGFHGEIKALRILRNIVRNHPDWTSEKIEDELVSQIYTDDRRMKTTEVFNFVKTELLKHIEEQNSDALSAEEKSNLRTRLDNVVLQLPPPASLYADAADLFTKNEVYYQRTGKGEIRLRVGGAYLLNASSFFNAVFTFAHELAHSIDPCELQAANVRPPVYEPLIQCFVKAGWVKADRSRCGPREQVSEVFADWIATQILAKLLMSKRTEYSKSQRQIAAVNAVRDLCEQSAGIDKLVLSHHQSPEVRINSIFSAHPTIAQSLGCRPPTPSSYCQFENLSATTKDTP